MLEPINCTLGPAGAKHQESVRVFLKEIEKLESFSQSALTPEAWQEKIAGISTELGEILLGQSDEYVPLPNWNKKGFIDEYCADQLELAVSDPSSRMEQAVSFYIAELGNLIASAGDRISSEEFTADFEELVLRYINLFTREPLSPSPLLEPFEDGG